MKTISMATLQSRINARKAMIGMTDTPAELEAMRNKGAYRTTAKRELLRRVQERARAAGLRPVTSHF